MNLTEPTVCLCVVRIDVNSPGIGFSRVIEIGLADIDGADRLVEGIETDDRVGRRGFLELARRLRVPC